MHTAIHSIVLSLFYSLPPHTSSVTFPSLIINTFKWQSFYPSMCWTSNENIKGFET